MFSLADLVPVLHAVEEASLAVLDIYHGDFAVATKADETPVTAADLAANAILLRELARAFPDIPVVSEESAPPFAGAGAVPSRFFLVDPIDGTRDFIKRTDEFTVNVALIEHGYVVAGVVAAPALDQLFWGVVGQGAWLRAISPSGDAQAVDNAHRGFDPRRPGTQPVRVLMSVSHRDPDTDAMVAALPAVVPLFVGSSLKFCRLAQGLADYYPRKKSLHEWDIAAGHAVLKAAGGNVYHAGTRTEITYGNADFATPFFEAYG
jgi:3'(2'), 5'-bisphosphate nucleotidase